jgi:hypothetical protein
VGAEAFTVTALGLLCAGIATGATGRICRRWRRGTLATMMALTVAGFTAEAVASGLGRNWALCWFSLAGSAVVLVMLARDASRRGS